MTKKMTSLTWSVVAVMITIAIIQPVGLQAQFLFALGGVAMMGAIKAFKLKGVWRQMFLLIGSVIVFRYLYWRVTSTLPPVSEPWNFVPGVLLFMAEVYSVSMLAINMVVVADPIRRRKEPLRGEAKDWPTVDIFVPTYNEDLEILGVTLAAARNLDYPTDKLNVYMLDDGGTDFRCNHHKDPKVREGAKKRKEEFSAFCKELGVNYLTRLRNEHAKAGNMNEALKTTKGEIVVVFDADHAPSRDFLKKTIGYFQADPKLFLVQTPHQFLNPDPVEKNIGSFDIMPSENEMFYSIIQRGLDKWNGSFFCGSAAVLRRVALNEVGGFAGITITEDCETAVELHSRGWNSAYVDEPMIAGFQPETFTSFIGQRSRWCQGMLQILILKRPAFKKGLSMPQRLAYLSIMLNWLFPLSRFMFMIAPAFFILFDLHIYNASFDEFLAFTLFSFIASSMMQNYIFGSVRWPWMSELYEYVQSWHLSRAIISVILRPRSPSFNVTNKAETLEQDFFSDSGWFHLGMFGLLLTTVVVGIWRMMQESGTNELLYVVGFWALFNLVMAGLGLGAVSERKQRRRHYRMPYAGGQVNAVLEIGDGRHFGVIKDIAIGGLCVEVESTEGFTPEQMTGQTVKLSLVRGRRREDRVLHTFNVTIRWAKTEGGNMRIGLEFFEPNALDRRAQALLMFPSSEALARYRANRFPDIKVTAGTLQFLKWAGHQTGRGLAMAFAEIKMKLDEKRKSMQTAKVAPTVAAAAPQAQATAEVTAQQPDATAIAALNTGQLFAPAAPVGDVAALPHFAAVPMPAAAVAPEAAVAALRPMPSMAMPSMAMPAHQPGVQRVPRVAVPVSPFASGQPATILPATPMHPGRMPVAAPSMAPQGADIAALPAPVQAYAGTEMVLAAPTGQRASTVAAPRSLPLAPLAPEAEHVAIKSSAAKAREVPLS
jgi:cellulose synthase (UDP-forming)